MGQKTAPQPPEKMFHPATLLLQAALILDENLRENVAFQGYTGDAADVTRLLAQLCEIYGAPQPVGPCEHPQELVEAWYEEHAYGDTLEKF